jgi:type I restriction enzyme S subunit
VRKDDILFSTVRTNLRRIARIEHHYPNPVASTGFAILRAAEGVSSQFLLFQVLSEDFLEPLNALQSGTNYPAVHARDVFAQPILLPPTGEQERIVAKLAVALSGVERAATAARRAWERLRRYRTAVLHAAVTGDLTREWREGQWKNNKENYETGAVVLQRILAARLTHWEETELKRLIVTGKAPRDDRWKSRYREPAHPNTLDFPDLPETWAWASLEMVAEIGSGISVSQNRIVNNPVELPYLRVANVLRGYLDFGEIKTIRVEKDRVPDYVLRAGDILFNEGGDRDKLGRGWVWEGQIRECVYQNHVFRARLVDPLLLNPKLVSHWGNTFGQRFFLKHGTQTTNLASINRKVLGRLPIPIAPIEEQTKILSEVDHRLSAADRLAASLEEQLKRAQLAHQSVLREAFAGRLVPQRPGEEPASALLERTRAAREAQKQKGNRMPKSKPIMKDRGHRNLLEILKEKGGPMTPEELFRVSGHSQESVDQFFAELRDLTTAPAKIAEERRGTGATLLRALP